MREAMAKRRGRTLMNAERPSLCRPVTVTGVMPISFSQAYEIRRGTVDLSDEGIDDATPDLSDEGIDDA
jgi:hypothetical protein